MTYRITWHEHDGSIGDVRGLSWDEALYLESILTVTGGMGVRRSPEVKSPPVLVGQAA